MQNGLMPSLIASESGGNFQAQNDVMGAGGQGHFGRGQFSIARLEDAKRAGVIPPDMTPEQFLQDEASQMRVEQWHAGDIMNRVKQTGLDRYVGQEINGVSVTPEGMLAVAHLGGFDGLQKFLETGGQYNPADAYGTSLQDYLQSHGAGMEFAPQGTGGQQGAQGPRNAFSGGQEGQRQADPRQNALAALTGRDKREDEPKGMNPEPFMARGQFNALAEFEPRYLMRG